MEALIRRKDESSWRHRKPPERNGAVGYLRMVSHDTAVERVTGIEPAQSAWKAWKFERHPGGSTQCQPDVVPCA
jgi:hypothetical protein